MAYSKSPSRPTKIMSETFLKNKTPEFNDSNRKLQDELFSILKENKELQSRVVRHQTDSSSVIQLMKEENKNFLSRLKKAVEKKTSQKMTFSTSDPFILKNLELIKISLKKKGFAMGNLVESKEELDKYDVSKSNKFSRQPSIKTVVKETTITSNKNVDSQIDKNNEVFLDILETKESSCVSSNLRALIYSRLISDN